MADDFDKLNSKLEKTSKRKEKDVAKRYAGLMREINQLLSKQFEKYEKDGALTYNEMAKHNRLEKLLKQVDKQINSSETGLRNEIKGHLNRQYQDAYYQTAFLMETESQAKLAYTTVKDAVIDEAVNNKFTGLTLNERLSRRRGELVTKMRETITRGLVEGQTYKSMSKIIKDDLEGDLSKANRIVRTESKRIRETANLNSVKHAQDKGIIMNKTWNTVQDERVRSGHEGVDGTTIPVDEKFIVNGYEAERPLDRSLPASESINCRCYLTYEIEKVEKPTDENLADLSYAEWQKERLS